MTSARGFEVASLFLIAMGKTILWSIPVVVLATAGLYVWLKGQIPEPEVVELPAPPEEPAIRHPIEEVRPPDAPAAAPTEPLPALSQSDGAMRKALTGLLGKKAVTFFYPENMIHRFVATVDNLPRQELSLRLMPVKPVAKRPVTTGKGEKLSLSPRNAARYLPYVRLLETAPVGALVAVYARFYPLFQEQYEKLGYPGKYFNDRLVEVIDHLLAAPEVQGPVRLVQPKVLYHFADPTLEQLSSGQKILVRMGENNAAKVKTKLREIRNALVLNAPKS